MEHRTDVRLTSRLERLSDRVVGRQGVDHVLVRIESGDGTWCWDRATASAEGEPARADGAFHLASVTKLYTATLVLQLVEQGALGLRDPIARCLPSEVTTELHVLDGVDHTAEITVEHLLTHASGLPDYFTDAAKGETSLARDLTAGIDRSWTIDDIVAWARGNRPHFAPPDLDAARVRIRYSDTNYQLLGALVASVTGGSFEDAVHRHVLEPLDFRRTWFAGSVPASTPVSQLWAGSRPLTIPRTLSAMGPDGALVSTPSDAIGFLRAVRGGDPRHGRETFEAMAARWHRFGLPRDRAALVLPSWPIEYGLGMMRFRPPRVLNAGRRAPHLLGHTGSSGSWLFHCPDLDVYLCGTVDQTDAAAVPYRLVPALLRALTSEA